MVAAGERRGDMRWLVVGGTCGRTAAWGDGGWWRAHAGGSLCGACGARVVRGPVKIESMGESQCARPKDTVIIQQNFPKT